MRTVAVIGAGFSGTMLAAHLLRGEPAGAVRVVLVERGPKFARGIAYGTSLAACLLNVPAGRMSAFPDDPDHFLRWAQARDPRIGGGSFPQRALYGEYLGSILSETESRAAGRLVRVHGEAVGARPPAAPGEAAGVVLRDGRTIEAHAVALATGNFPPGDPPIATPSFYSSALYARDPWAPGAIESAPAHEPVLLLGTGLTMLDVALALRAQGHAGQALAVSRRGLLPQPHRVSVRPPRSLPFPASMRPLLEGATALELLRALRREALAGARRGDDWREVVTSLRGSTPALWRAMDGRERARFLRSLQPFWETHRHRAAPDTAAGIADAMERGRLSVRAGRVVDMREEGDAVVVTLRARGGGGEETLRVGRVINCTGPDTDMRRVRDPLLASLRDDGLVRADGLGLGLEAGAGGNAIDAGGAESDWLFLAGPLRKGELWETTAVPELRAQAPELAKAVAQAVRSGGRAPAGQGADGLCGRAS